MSNAALFSSEPVMYEPGSLMPSDVATGLRPTGATVKKIGMLYKPCHSILGSSGIRLTAC